MYADAHTDMLTFIIIFMLAVFLQDISAVEIKENSSEVTNITLEAAQFDYNPIQVGN